MVGAEASNFWGFPDFFLGGPFSDLGHRRRATYIMRNTIIQSMPVSLSLVQKSIILYAPFGSSRNANNGFFLFFKENSHFQCVDAFNVNFIK